MWTTLEVIFDRPDSHKPPRTKPLESAPTTAKTMSTALYVETTGAAELSSVGVVTSSLLFASVWKFVVTSSAQAAVDDMTIPVRKSSQDKDFSLGHATPLGSIHKRFLTAKPLALGHLYDLSPVRRRVSYDAVSNIR